VNDMSHDNAVVGGRRVHAAVALVLLFIVPGCRSVDDPGRPLVGSPAKDAVAVPPLPLRASQGLRQENSLPKTPASPQLPPEVTPSGAADQELKQTTVPDLMSSSMSRDLPALAAVSRSYSDEELAGLDLSGAGIRHDLEALVPSLIQALGAHAASDATSPLMDAGPVEKESQAPAARPPDEPALLPPEALQGLDLSQTADNFSPLAPQLRALLIRGPNATPSQAELTLNRPEAPGNISPEPASDRTGQPPVDAEPMPRGQNAPVATGLLPSPTEILRDRQVVQTAYDAADQASLPPIVTATGLYWYGPAQDVSSSDASTPAAVTFWLDERASAQPRSVANVSTAARDAQVDDQAPALDVTLPPVVNSGSRDAATYPKSSDPAPIVNRPARGNSPNLRRSPRAAASQPHAAVQGHRSD
jgi:hypothetical protein